MVIAKIGWVQDSLASAAVFPDKKRRFLQSRNGLTEIMRPCAGDSREVDDPAIRLGAVGSRHLLTPLSQTQWTIEQ